MNNLHCINEFQLPFLFKNLGQQESVDTTNKEIHDWKNVSIVRTGKRHILLLEGIFERNKNFWRKNSKGEILTCVVEFLGVECNGLSDQA